MTSSLREGGLFTPRQLCSRKDTAGQRTEKDDGDGDEYHENMVVAE